MHGKMIRSGDSGKSVGQA